MSVLPSPAPDGTRIPFGSMGIGFPGAPMPPDMPPLPHPDAELLDLAGEFIAASNRANVLMDAWRDLGLRVAAGEAVPPSIERGAEASQAWVSQRRQASHIARRAAALPANTPAGLIAKAQICRASTTGCAKLAKSLANDLLGNPALRRIVFPVEVL